MKGWQLVNGDGVVLGGERFYLREAIPGIGNIIILRLRREDGSFAQREVYTEQEVETYGDQVATRVRPGH